MIDESLVCKECGSLYILLRRGGYSVCPNGHGKLKPGVSAAVLRHAHRALLVNSFPLAVRQNTTRLGSRVFSLGGKCVVLGGAVKIKGATSAGMDLCRVVSDNGAVRLYKYTDCP